MSDCYIFSYFVMHLPVGEQIAVKALLFTTQVHLNRRSAVLVLW